MQLKYETQVTTYYVLNSVEISEVIASNLDSRLACHLRWFKITPVSDLPRGIDYPMSNASCDGLREPITGSIAHRIIYPTREATNGREFKPSRMTSQSRVEIGHDDLRTFYTPVKRPLPPNRQPKGQIL